MRRIVRNVALEMALQQRSTGRRIAQQREKLHLTQEAAADLVGVTLRAYQKWEAGGGIQYDNLVRLAGALRVSVDELTGNAEPSAAEATPDPFRTAGQLDRIEAALRTALARQETMLVALRRIAPDAPELQEDIDRALGLVDPPASISRPARASGTTAS